MGLDYVDVDGNGDVSWVIENNGYVSDTDVRRVWLGKLRGQHVHLRDHWGGGTVSIDTLRSRANSFWNYYDDMSGDSTASQDLTLKSLLGGMRLGAVHGGSSRGVNAQFVAGGLVTGYRALGNAAVDTVVSTATIGTVDGLNAFGGQDEFGYEGSYMLSRFGTEVLAAVGTGALSAPGKVGKLGKVATAVNTMDLVSNGVGILRAGADIQENGLNWVSVL